MEAITLLSEEPEFLLRSIQDLGLGIQLVIIPFRLTLKHRIIRSLDPLGDISLQGFELFDGFDDGKRGILPVILWTWSLGFSPKDKNHLR